MLMKKIISCFLFLLLITLIACETPEPIPTEIPDPPVTVPEINMTEIQYLSGTGSDNRVNWEFYCTEGRNSRTWRTIPVPSCWEMEGFGTYQYGGYTAAEQGRYRYNFEVPSSWTDKSVYIVFEGSMTDTQVWINGKSAGPKHQGAFYRFKYDISNLLNYNGSNLIEVTVDKKSSNASVNEAERQADYWVFGGIYRPVYLEAYPNQFIERVAIDAKASGAFNVDVYLKNIQSANSVACQIKDMDGNDVGAAFSQSVTRGQQSVRLSTVIANPDLWDAENPHLYQAEVTLNSGDTAIHALKERFGFRTVDVRRGDGIYVNGNKIMFKGVNRHAFHPDSGRTLNAKIDLEDVLTIKEMNMNAVRMSHYPPDQSFLDYCDENGLYVLDELAGWQDSYDSRVGTILANEMVDRDVNHPSIILWDNANELNLTSSDYNRDLTNAIYRRDPQGRKVVYPRGVNDGMDTLHYPTYQTLSTKLRGPNIYFPTEFLHGLYDGGHGAGLDDFWDLMQSSRLSAGGFLWVYADEGVMRTDTGRIDTEGNRAPDGILGPYHEREGSFYTIKEIWSPVQLTNEAYYENDFPANFNGSVGITNDYDHTNLNQCNFFWELVNYKEPGDNESGYTVVDSGTPESPNIAPGESGYLSLNLPAGWMDYDALFFTAEDSTGMELWTWKWTIKKAADHKDSIVVAGTGTASGRSDNAYIYMSASDTELRFRKSDGQLDRVMQNSREISFNNGPMVASRNQTLRNISGAQTGSSYTVTANYAGDMQNAIWTIYPSGWVKLEYKYNTRATGLKFLGVNFSYPELQMSGVRWLGKGPYRVWKNRMQGVTHDVWQKDYNDTMTGSTQSPLEYPEFSGYYSDMYWAALETVEGTILAVSEDENLFLRLYTPEEGVNPEKTTTTFPGQDISFLDGIEPIGTKFNEASTLGPESQGTTGAGEYMHTIYFQFTSKEYTPEPGDTLRIINSIAGSEEAENPAVNSHDGKTTTRWCNDGTLENAWIEYTLNTSYAINGVRMFMHKAASDGRTYPVTIEIDGRIVYRGNTAAGQDWTDIALRGAFGRRIRVTMTDANSSSNYWFCIHEVEIY